MNRRASAFDESWITIEGIGFWASGLPSWDAAKAFVATGTLPEQAPARPAARLLAPNEQRRAPETVVVALEVGHAACQAAGRDPATLPSVFTSTHGDLAITDAMCSAIANDPLSVSPIRFHNSVHNAAAGYWTIGVGSMQPATALSAYDASFAQGLIEAAGVLASGAPVVLLVAYDSQAVGPLATLLTSTGLLGGALVLSQASRPQAPRLRMRVEPGSTGAIGALQARCGGNAMAPMLPLFDALATGAAQASLHAGPNQRLQIALASSG